MNQRTLTLLALYFLASGGVAAQQLYKSVGPDGKVTYTDRPPAGDASAKVSVMKSYILRPVDAPPPPSLSSALPVPAGDAAKKAATDAAAAGTGKTGMSLEVEQAVAGVLSLSELFRRSEEVCSRGLAPGSKRYPIVLAKWRERNATFLKKQQKILMEVISPALRAALQSAVDEKNDKVLQPVSAAQPGVRAKWCDKGFDDLDAGMHDIANNPALSVPLITYTAR
jgi:hypothetical protein